MARTIFFILITLDNQRITLPAGREVLRADDLLALDGTRESADAAVEILQ